jgi:hypothetical protein
MKKWFFHQEKGNTLGPITLDEMKNRVREGRIRLFDLVYREGEPGWRMALEHPDLRGEFKTSTVKTLVDRPWVCLQRKSETGFEFGTSGPFSTDDIRLSLQEGLISYSDYVWRDGFSEWKRIGSLEDFNRRLAESRERKDRRGTSAKEKAPLPDVPGKELLKSVVEMKRAEPPANPAVPPPPPPEAATPDLTSNPAPPPVVEKRKSSKPVAHDRRAKPMETPPDFKKASRRRRSSAWVDWAVVGGLAIVLCAVILTVGRYVQNSQTDNEPPIVEPAPVTAAPEPPAEPPKEREEVAPLEAPPEIPPDIKAEKKAEPVKSVAPTELTLNVNTSGPNQVKIDLRTDAAGEEYPVYLQIVGLPGQVADGAAYYKFLRLNTKGDRKEPLDLSGLNLPQGRFILRAETGTLKKETKMNVGVNETAFKQTVARLRKSYASAIWKERLELFRLSQVLEKHLTEAAGGKKFSTRGLEAIGNVKRTNGANYILYDQWFEMKEILTAAKTAPSIALLGRLRQARERLATFSVWK